ncbi:hypothetical protein K432DRAFT_298513 [Lepidopterella palustris CBS 459.81]|uniref:Uncharacterized protein n=1 Tax=Lepidopterella palustris CBS 459.81 TaxID=1314670 RepID=A0A8E2JEY8_9PEZI|nr:hypothetical protein K432DRAFT_298513 [Lepidopterella palustris CBS 459.81]
MSGAGHSGESAGNALKKGVGMIHGAGEVIRGSINTFADSAVGSKEGSAKNQAVVDRGVHEMNTGHHHGTGAGVTPIDTAQERHNRTMQGKYDGVDDTDDNTVTGSSNYGPHNTDIGNNADPRLDSDLGMHR